MFNLIEITGNCYGDMGIPIGSGITRFPGLVSKVTKGRHPEKKPLTFGYCPKVALTPPHHQGHPGRPIFTRTISGVVTIYRNSNHSLKIIIKLKLN